MTMNVRPGARAAGEPRVSVRVDDNRKYESRGGIALEFYVPVVLTTCS